MQRLRGHIGLRAVVLALYALAMLSLGFAHAALRVPAVPAGIDLAAYTLPDGSLPSICLNVTSGKDTSRQHAGSALCDACLLTGSPGLVLADATASFAAPSAFEPVSIETAGAMASGRTGYVAHLRGPPVPAQAA